MKTHHPWWPHLDREPIFNPFVSVTTRRPADDRIDLPDYDEEEEADDQAVQRPVKHPTAEK